jgi:septal ring factor EnvC (AmiA/AmiB activator)
MSTTWLAITIAIIGLIGSIGGARLANRGPIRAAKISADETAFIRATEIYDAGQQEFKERVDRLRADFDDRLGRVKADLLDTSTQLGETVRELAETRQELKAARAEIGTLRRSGSQYEGRVIQLEVVLRMHDIEVPPWTLMPSDMGLLPGSIPDPNQPAFTQPGDDPV